MRSLNWKIYLMAIAAMSFWGFSFVWVKIVYEYLNPISTVFIRLLSAAVILLTIKTVFKIGVTPAKGDMKLLLLLSFTEPFLYFLGESFGMKYISSTLASVIISTIPVFSMIIAWIFVKEKLSLINIVGIIISFVGIIILVLQPDLTFKESPLGIALMMLAVFAAVFYTILIKKLSAKYKPLTILTWQYIFGTLLFLPLFLIFDYSDFIKVKPDIKLVTTMLELIIFASILAFFFFIQVVDNLGITKTNVFTNFVPVVTAITAWILLPDEYPSVKNIVGIMIVIFGIFFSQIKRKSGKSKKATYVNE